MGSCERDGDGEAPWTPDPQLCESPEALSVFERRIAPLLADDTDPARRDQAEALEAGRTAHMPAWNDYGRELFRRFAKRCR